MAATFEENSATKSMSLYLLLKVIPGSGFFKWLSCFGFRVKPGDHEGTAGILEIFLLV